MSAHAQVGGLPQKAFRVCLGVFLGASLVVVVARTFIRIKGRHKFSIDDILLIFAIMCISVGTGLAYTFIPYAYIESGRFALLDNDLPKLIWALKITGVYFTMTWTATFAARLSVLFFFKSLVERIPDYNRWVKVVIVFNLLVWAFCVCSLYIVCPHFGKSAVKNCLPPNKTLSFVMSYMAAILDILSDVSILSIPILILWNAQMNIRKKLGVGAFLMMNIWLIILWPIRLVLAKPGVSHDLTWTLFFQFVEPNIAIIVACFSAFRSLFVRHNPRPQQQQIQSRAFRKSSRSESQVDISCEASSRQYPDDEFMGQSEESSISDLGTTGEPSINLHGPDGLYPSRIVRLYCTNTYSSQRLK